MKMTAFYCICVYRRASGKESACNAGATGDVGLILGGEDSLEKEMVLQNSCLENSMDTGAWGL